MPTYKYLNDTGLERTLSKLKDYIDSQSGGGSDVKGAIIFDTTTLSVGNIVRARSITNSFHIYEQTVLESGPQIVMRVEPFEQWKICLVKYGVPTVKIETESTTALSVSVTVQGTNKSKHTVNSTDTAYGVSCVSIAWNNERSAWVMTATADCVFNSNSYSNGDEIDAWGEDDVVELTVVGELQESVEIGGVYKTVDYGQTLFINVLDKTTFGGIQGILNAHQETELLAIGDEVTITVGGNPWIMQVGRIDGTSHFIDFVSKYIYQLSVFNAALKNTSYVDSTVLRPAVQDIYTEISEADRQYIKEVTREAMHKNATWVSYTDKIWIPTYMEAVGTYPSSGTPTTPQSQMPIFTTQAGRIRTYNGVAEGWWSVDHATSSNVTASITSTGAGTGNVTETSTRGILPCFRLMADS